ncbi:MAG TPA: hypothetical protein VKQ30_25380 [Ktedonobacterales bacterium]|nr:hypothetical protein [Ktedonobacterales bacterium]
MDARSGSSPVPLLSSQERGRGEVLRKGTLLLVIASRYFIKEKPKNVLGDDGIAARERANAELAAVLAKLGLDG